MRRAVTVVGGRYGIVLIRWSGVVTCIIGFLQSDSALRTVRHQNRALRHRRAMVVVGLVVRRVHQRRRHCQRRVRVHMHVARVNAATDVHATVRVRRNIMAVAVVVTPRVVTRIVRDHMRMGMAMAMCVVFGRAVRVAVRFVHAVVVIRQVRQVVVTVGVTVTVSVLVTDGVVVLGVRYDDGLQVDGLRYCDGLHGNRRRRRPLHAQRLRQRFRKSLPQLAVDSPTRLRPAGAESTRRPVTKVI